MTSMLMALEATSHASSSGAAAAAAAASSAAAGGRAETPRLACAHAERVPLVLTDNTAVSAPLHPRAELPPDVSAAVAGLRASIAEKGGLWRWKPGLEAHFDPPRSSFEQEPAGRAQTPGVTKAKAAPKKKKKKVAVKKTGWEWDDDEDDDSDDDDSDDDGGGGDDGGDDGVSGGVAIPMPPSEEEEACRAGPVDLSLLVKKHKFSAQEELRRLSGGGARRVSLTPEQLAEVRRAGRFSVQSLAFPGQSHVWELSRMLQMGSEPNAQRTRAMLALAAEFVVIAVPNLLRQARCGLVEAVRAVLDIPNALVGWRLMRRRWGDAAVAELVAEKRQAFALEGITRVPDSDDTFVSPDGGVIFDCRIYSREVKTKFGHLRKEFEAEWAAQRPTFRKAEMRRAAAEAAQGGAAADRQAIAQRIADAEVLEENRRFLAMLAASERLFAPGVARALAEHLEATRLVADAEKQHSRARKAAREAARADLKAAHPVLGRVTEWLQQRVERAVEAWDAEHRWDAAARAIAALEAAGGHAPEALLLRRDLEFRRSEEAALAARLAAVRVPAKTFTFTRRIWHPRRFPIRRMERAFGVEYTLEQQQTVQFTSRWPLWRPRMFLYRTLFLASDGLFALLVANLGFGPLSPRTLWGTRPFRIPLYSVSDEGQLVRRDGPQVQTWLSRAARVVRHIRRSRARFEARPDTGFLGKNVTRVFNQAWNYGLKGTGLLVALAVPPVLVLLNTVLTLALAAAVPLWAPGLSALDCAVQVLFYDRFCHPPWFPLLRLAGRVLFSGVGRTAASLVALSACPALAAATVVLAQARRAVRAAWDLAIFRLVIRKHARVPQQTAFLVRRVRGPGLASRHHLRVPPDIAIVGLQCVLERAELERYEEAVRQQIAMPEKALRALYNTLLPPLGVRAPVEPSRLALHAVLAEDARRYTKAIARLCEERRARLPISGHVPEKLRQSADDAFETLQRGEVLVRRFFEERFVPHASAREAVAFWARLQLEPGDWRGLAAHYLGRFFSPRFLVPLEDEDCLMSIEITHMDLTRFARMLAGVCPVDPLERFVFRYAPAVKSASPSVCSLLRHTAAPAAEFEALLDETKGFQAERVVLSSPAYAGHGLRIALTGRKNRAFAVSNVRLVAEGAELWDCLGDVFGSVLLATLRSTVHPLVLHPHYMDAAGAFRRGKRSASFTIEIGTGRGGQGWVKFRDVTIRNQLEKLVALGDPRFVLALEYTNADVGTQGFIPEGRLLAVAVSPSIVLRALDSGENLAGRATK